MDLEGSMKRHRWQKQRIWKPRGWSIMYSWGQCCGLGIFLCGWHWITIRVNGGELLLGPISISIQPPTPKWLTKELSEAEADKAAQAFRPIYDDVIE
jgi:hypothetical protein